MSKTDVALTMAAIALMIAVMAYYGIH